MVTAIVMLSILRSCAVSQYASYLVVDRRLRWTENSRRKLYKPRADCPAERTRSAKATRVSEENVRGNPFQLPVVCSITSNAVINRFGEGQLKSMRPMLPVQGQVHDGTVGLRPLSDDQERMHLQPWQVDGPAQKIQDTPTIIGLDEKRAVRWYGEQEAAPESQKHLICGVC